MTIDDTQSRTWLMAVSKPPEEKATRPESRGWSTFLGRSYPRGDTALGDELRGPMAEE